jgi:hypothetical protein
MFQKLAKKNISNHQGSEKSTNFGNKLYPAAVETGGTKIWTFIEIHSMV